MAMSNSGLTMGYVDKLKKRMQDLASMRQMI